MTSIRRALTVRLVTGTFVMLVAASSLLGVASHSWLLREFDRALETKARALATLTSREGQTLEVDFTGEHMPEFESEDDPEYFQMLLQDGSVVEKSVTLGERELPFGPPLSGDPRFFDSRLPDGRRGRLVQMVISPRAEDEDEPGEREEEDEEGLFEIPSTLDAASVVIVLTVARSREDFDTLLMFLCLTLAASGVLLLLGIGMLVHISIGKGLQPIDAINNQISAIGSEALDSRVRLPRPPKELETILHVLNSLMERLQSAFERERRFSSDVAHELRTPVTELRAACEVGGKWPEDTDSIRRFFRDIQEISLQMERIVTNLLVLARCDNGTATVTREVVRVEPLIQTCWNRVSEKAKTRQLRFDLRVDPRMTVRTDGGKLEMIIQNLIDNAVSHSAPGSVISCASDSAAPGFGLIIENKAADLASADMEHLFERFWRKDTARTDSNHSGLGLSIVKALSELLGIGVGVELKQGAIFEVRLSSPAEAL